MHAPAQKPAKWSEHRDGSRLTLVKPADWQVHARGGDIAVGAPGAHAAAQERSYFRVKRTPRFTAIGIEIDVKPVSELDDLTRLLKIGTEVPDR